MRSGRLALAILLSAAGCSTDLPHQNPFDPQTPPQMQSTATLVGSVSLEAGAVPADPSTVEVSLLGASLTAHPDADGAYAISGVPPGSYTVRASKDGYQTTEITGVTVRLENGDGQVAVPAIKLPIARGAVAGLIALEGSASSAGITVELSGTGWSGSVQTDSHGRFTFAGTPVGLYTLAASKPAFVSLAVADLPVKEGQTLVVPDKVLAANPGSITGSVSLRGQSDQGGVLVTADGTTLAGEHHFAQVTTLSDGAVTLSRIPAGLYTVSFAKAGFVTSSTSTAVSPGTASSLAPVELIWESGAIVGSAKLAGQGDSSGIQVALTPAPTAAAPNPDPLQVALTDRSGAWRMNDLPVGDYTLAYRKVPGYKPASGTIRVVKQSVVAAADVALEAIPGQVQGTVLLEGVAAGGDLSATTVRIEGTNLSTATLANGTFTLDGVGSGVQTLVFERPSYETQRVQAGLAPGDILVLNPVTLALSRGAVHGALLVEERTSASGVQVALYAGSSKPAAMAFTDPQGAFAISGVPAGNYTLSASLSDYAPLTGIPVVVTANGDTEAPPASAPASGRTLTVLRTAKVQGSALSQPSGDQSGTTATLTGNDLNGVAVTPALTATSGVDGSFSFTGLPAGTYRVVLSRTGYQSIDLGLVPLATGATATLPAATLDVARGAVAGSYRLQGATSHGGILVSVQGTTFTAVTNSSGDFSLSGIPVGAQTLVASLPPNYISDSRTVTLSAGTTAPLPGSPVTLAVVSAGTVTGTVTLEAATDHRNTLVNLTGADFQGNAVSRSANTDLNGAFTIGSLLAGSYQLSYSHAGYDSVSGIAVTVSASAGSSAPPWQLALSRGSLSGSVLATGAPDQSGTVITVSGPDNAAAVTDSTGAWHLTGLRAGSGYTATARRPGYSPASSATFAVPVSANFAVPTLTIVPSTGASITGSALVERPAGAAASANINVSLTGVDLNGAAVTTATVTASGGGYSFTGLKQGTYKLVFSKSGYDSAQISGIAVAADAAVTVPGEMLTVSKGSIFGRVLLTSGLAGLTLAADNSGVTVSLGGTDVPVAPVTTDLAGNYLFTNVPVSLAGTAFTVTASKPNFVASAAFPTVIGVANASQQVADIGMKVNAGSLSGTAITWDNAGGLGANATSAGISISISGSAFNGSSFATSGGTTVGSGAWGPVAVPPGSYSVVATLANHGCSSTSNAVVAEGSAVPVSPNIRCTDTVPPSGMALGTPQAPNANAVAGYTNLSSVVVPIAAASSDPVNFEGYELSVGLAPKWPGTIVPGQPATLTFSLAGLADGSWSLWARGLDWAGNAGPTASTTVVLATAPLAVPVITVAASVISSVGAAVLLTESDKSPNFLQYEACSGATGVGAATAPCPAAPSCALAPVTSSYSVMLQANQRNCIWAAGRSKAGVLTAVTRQEIVSDQTAPTGPTVVPAFDSNAFVWGGVRTEYAEFFVTAPATDAPLNSATAWANIAWIEVDSGNGFNALCPAAGCHPNGIYAPCSCGCSDPRLVCRDGALYSVKVPFQRTGGVAVSVRAVDLAGNVGSAASQFVPVTGGGYPVSATSFEEGQPRMRGRVMTYAGVPSTSGTNSVHVVDLGTDQIFQTTDPNCEISSVVSSASNNNFLPLSEPMSATAVIYSDWTANALKVRRAGVDGIFCSPVPPGAVDDVTVTVKTIGAAYPHIEMVSGSMDMAGTAERAAWTEVPQTGATAIRVREGGADKLLGTADDVETLVASVSGSAVVTLNGDTLVYGGGVGFTNAWATAGLVAVNATGGTFAARTTWNLPATAGLAALDEGGKTLAYFGNEAGLPTLHVRTAGADGKFGTADDTDVAQSWAGPTVTDGGLAIRGGHVVLTEAANAAKEYYVDHWQAGADGIYGTKDDVFSRIMPGSVPRFWPSLGTGIAQGKMAYQSGQYRSNGDVLGTDLSTLRWEVVGSAPPMFPPVSNRAGTLFYVDSARALHARTSDGRETTLAGTSINGYVAADGANLFVPSGSSVLLHRPDSGASSATKGQFFVPGAPAAATIATFTNTVTMQGAGAGRAFVRDTNLGTLYLLEPNGSILTPTTVALENSPAGYVYWPIPGNPSVSALHLVFSCNNMGTKVACVREPSGGVYGTAQDRITILTNPSNVNHTNVYGIAVSGNRVAFVADGTGGPHLFVLDGGADQHFGLFNAANDDIETDWGLMPDARVGGLDLVGNYLAWSTDIGVNLGQQVVLGDVTNQNRILLTLHFSPKPYVVLDQGGRVYWTDMLFPTGGIFMHQP